MKTLFLLAITAFLSAATLYHFNFQDDFSGTTREEIYTYKKNFSLGCSPNLLLINFEDSSDLLPLLDGWGDYRMPVTSSNDSAFVFFQQGINMYYGFHIIESLASFEKAIRFDRNFAMAYWGKALAYGPNINDVEYATSPKAIEALQQAKTLSANCSEFEKALIDALQTRYSQDSTLSRTVLNQHYADAMKTVYKKFTGNADAAALFADALMVQHPWDLYDKHYEPKSWTPEIVSVLEEILSTAPEHPGATHYYIHAIEGSKHPQKGLAAADRLGKMITGVAHLVHMPSHIYIRSGNYDKGITANDKAVKAYYNYKARYPQTAGNPFLYEGHNLHMQAACANMAARYKESMQLSEATRNSVDKTWFDAGGYFSMYGQYLYMTPLFTQVRFGKWDDILNMEPVPESLVYANKIWHYGRGMALARQHRLVEAKQELVQLQSGSTSDVLTDHPATFNPGSEAIKVASFILEGTIAQEGKQFDDAIRLYMEAVKAEDGMIYNEPKDWPHPTRQYLGNMYLLAGNTLKAEETFLQDLEHNPHNAWSLAGLTESFKMRGKQKDAKAFEKKKKEALSKSDIIIARSVY